MHNRPHWRIFEIRPWAQLGGPLLALVAAGIIELLSRRGFQIPIPPAILLMLVVLSGFTGGIASGLVTAVIGCLYFAYVSSTPSHPLHYTVDNLHRVLVWAVTTPATAIMVGMLKRHLDLALHRSASRETAILQGALDCIITMDQRGRILEFNPAAETTFKYRRNDVLGRALADVIIPPALREPHRLGLAHYLATGENPILNKRIEITAVRSTGEEFPVELTVVRNPSSEPPVFTGFARDISERKHAEWQLRHLAAIVEWSGDAILSQTLGGSILSWNAGAERIYGYRAEEAIGRSISFLVPTDHPDDTPSLLERLARGERIEHYEATRVRKDGVRIAVALTISPLKDAAGTITSASLIAHDITEQKQSDARRRQLLEDNSVLYQRYRSLFEGVPVGLYRSTSTGTFLDANPAFLHLLNYPSRETLTMSNAAALYPDPDVRARWVAMLQSEGVITDFECHLRRYDGTLVWVRTSAHLVRDGDGNTLYLEGAIIDITAQKAATEGLQKRTAELEAFYLVGRQLREARSVDEMYVLLVDHAMRLLSAEHGTLALLTEDRHSFERVNVAGLLSDAPGSVFPAARSLSATVVETGQPFVAADLASGALPTWPDTSPYSALGPILVVPVRSEREIIGTLCLARKRAASVQPFTEAEVRFLTALAEIDGTAIRRARLYDGLEQAYLQTVLALARTVDARDSYTGSHSDELARWVEALARRIGCGEDEVRDSR